MAVLVSPVVGIGEENETNEKETSYPSPGGRGSRGTTRYVGVGQTYSKIQDAINASQPGDTIRVYAGIYYENVLVNKTLTLIGNGSALTFVNGSFTKSVIKVTANWTNITGFNVQASGQGWDDNGITFEGVENCTITNNYFSRNDRGIYLMSSKNNTIADCSFHSNTWGGINLTESDKNVILNCTTYGGWAGIDITSSNGNFFYNNSCDSHYDGIRLHSNFYPGKNNYNEFIYNSIIDCTRYGIFIGCDCHNNSFNNNNFITNNKGGIQGLDSGKNNEWNTSSRGNYWSDWTSPDNNVDGIVDKPYNLSGAAGAKDHKPLVKPTKTFGLPPVITTSAVTTAYVNEFYYVKYYATDPDTQTKKFIWNMKTNASWLSFTPNQELKGTPFSSDIGFYWVNITVSDGINIDWSYFELYVSKNTTSPSAGNVIIVRTGQNYKRIQDAVDDSIPDDTILVWAGIYSENVVINKTLTLIGNSSKDTIIDAHEASAAITINANWCNISGFSAVRCYPWQLAGILVKGNNNTITDCNCSGNKNHGLWLDNANYNKIINCTIASNNHHGINLTNANNNYISNCTLVSNNNGIRLINSNGNIIENNNCTLNYHGIKLHYFSHYNKLIYNTIINNNKGGIIILPPNSRFNSIYYNNFIFNNIGSSDTQSYDFVGDNSWNSASRGNFWSDWTTPDSDSDGIVDIPYNLTGAIDAKDLYPLAQPIKTIEFPPNINTTNVLIAYVGKLYSVNYTAIDYDTPQNQLNWTMKTNASWLNFSTSQELFGTPSSTDVGTYWVYISVSDGDNSDSTNFTLLVKDQQTPTPPPNIGNVINLRTSQRFKKIQDAIDNATAGDTVRVYAGTYYENVVVDKTLTLIGNGSFTIVNGSNKGTVFTIKADYCNLSDFFIMGTGPGYGGYWPNYAGILLQSNFNTVANCTCTLNEVGIYIYNKGYNKIINCLFNSNFYHGINLTGTSNNYISSCSISFNRVGIGFAGSDANTIDNNTISQNSLYGIELHSSEGNTFTYNTLMKNKNVGLLLTEYSNHNLVHLNNMIDNNNGGKQATDTYKNNDWNGTSKGNYWSEWTSPDNNTDGIVDNPYIIGGNAGAKDHYPLTTIVSGTSPPPPTNKPPKIITQNVQTAYVGIRYSVNYTATDIDTPQNKLIWSMKTNATWLTFSVARELFGTPSSSDIGTYWVNINVSDGIADDFTNFTLKVHDRQIPPNITKPEVKSTFPGDKSDNVSINNTEIVITFSKSMNRSSVEAALSISPQVNYTLNWSKNDTELRISFTENLSYNTTYKINISTNARDTFGNNLKSLLKLWFTTQKGEEGDFEDDDGKPGEDRDQFEVFGIIIVIVISIIIIFLMLLAFITLNRRRKHEKLEKYDYADDQVRYSDDADEFIVELKKEALNPKKPSDFGPSKKEMLIKFQRKYNKGEISTETYNSIKESLLKEK